MQACWLVVALILEPGSAGIEEGGIVLRRRIATERDEALGSRAVDEEGPYRIQCIELSVEAVATVSGSQQRLVVGEGEIVEGRVLRIAENEDGDFPGIADSVKVDAEDGSPGAAGGQIRLIAGIGVGVAGGIEKECTEPGAGQELRVLGTLEGSGTRSLGGGIGIERCGSVHRCARGKGCRECAVSARVRSRTPVSAIVP